MRLMNSFERSGRKMPAMAIGLASALSMFGAQAFGQTKSATTAAAAPKPETPMVKFYGFVKPAVVVSNGVESFGQPNSNAVTMAAHPMAFSGNDDIAWSPQVMQTRLGVILGGDLPVQAKVEIDFLDVTKASPTTQINPRLRVAYVEYKASDSAKIGMGQNWDLFSPLNPNTYNLPGALLGGGGNAGFQRQQIWGIFSMGEVELALALGLAAPNTAASFGVANKSHTPTLALRAAYKTADLYAGASFIGSMLKFTKAGEEDKRQAAILGNIFAEYKMGKGNVKIDGYIGQNGASLGLLTLAAAAYDTNVAEVGGYISAAMPAGPVVPHISIGAAKILSTDKVGYGYTKTTDTTGAVTGITRGGYNAGVEYNIFLDGGVKYPVGAASFYLDGFFIATRHKLQAVDRKSDSNPDGKNSRALGGGVELGMLYAF